MFFSVMQEIGKTELHVALEHHLIPASNPLDNIAQLRQVNRAWRIAIDERLEYAALRLAVWDLEQLVGARWFTDAEFVRARFDNIMWRFSRSWTTFGRVPRCIQEAQLIHLSVVELAQLRDILEDAGSYSFFIGAEARAHAGPHVWLTPADRLAY
jgi:hypothetical protein